MVSMNAQGFGLPQIPCAQLVPGTDCSQPAAHGQWLHSQNPPRNRIRLILTPGTAFDMEAAGVIQNSGPVEQPESIAKANMFISTQRPLAARPDFSLHLAHYKSEL